MQSLWKVSSLPLQLSAKGICLFYCWECLALRLVICILIFLDRKRNLTSLKYWQTQREPCFSGLPSALDEAPQTWEAPERGAVRWCLKPELLETHPKAPIPQAQTRLEGGEAGRRDQLGGEFYFPFMVKALRSSDLFFTSRTVKRLSNKPFGCYKCVNMTPGFCTKCWRFSWKGAFLIWVFVIPSPLSSLILLGEGEGALFSQAFAL